MRGCVERRLHKQYIKLTLITQDFHPANRAFSFCSQGARFPTYKLIKFQYIYQLTVKISITNLVGCTKVLSLLGQVRIFWVRLKSFSLLYNIKFPLGWSHHITLHKQLNPYRFFFRAVASWLVHSSPDRVVKVEPCPGHCVLFLSTQLYKWVTADLIPGVTLRWTSIPSKGE